jgi:ParB family chromosome partitioning protein
MLQPVLVRPHGDRYQLIAGERRHRASVEARLHDIPARVMELDDQRISELAMVENLQREDLNALDKASAFRNYLDSYGGTQDELAGRLGLDRSTVSNLMRLLDLPGRGPGRRPHKKISQGHARALLGLADRRSQIAACARIIAESLSVRQTEALVQTGEPTPSKTASARTRPAGVPSGRQGPRTSSSSKARSASGSARRS